MRLHGYQQSIVDACIANNHMAIFADPGAGKTLAMLTLIKTLKLRTLVIAPIRVCNITWPQEIRKWYPSLTYSILHGPNKANAIKANTHIYLINPEGLKWLETQQLPKVDCIIFDESTRFKNPGSVSFRIAKRLVKSIPRSYIMTGTPVPNGLHDLWAQMYLVDQGIALGKTITGYRQLYFNEIKKNNFTLRFLKPESDKKIYEAIKPINVRVSYHDLPALTINDIYIDLDSKTRKEYDNALSHHTIGDNVIGNPSQLLQVLRQLTSGFCYIDNKARSLIKLEACRDIINDLQGKPVFIGYNYVHELQQLKSIGGVSIDEPNAIDRWSLGEIPILLGQPQSVGHGLNLQQGGNDIIWYSLTFDQECYEQFNRRIYRQGVNGPVRIHRLIARNTIDEIIIRALDNKSNVQQDMLDYMEAK